MKKNVLLLSCFLSCFASNFAFSQDYKGVDEEALRDTKIVGVINEKPPLLAQPASKEALALFLKNHLNEDFCVFPERRSQAISLYNTIPEVWTKRSPHECSLFSAEVSPGEYFTFQLGVYANNLNLEGLTYRAQGLSDITCFNLQGVAPNGATFSTPLDVKKGSVQPLWFGLPIPKDFKEGASINGSITLFTSNGKERRVTLTLTSNGKMVVNRGYNDDWRLSRLNWLNSMIAQDEEVTKGYTPIVYKNKVISILGRDIRINQYGLPEAINSFFDSGNLTLNDAPQPILSHPIKFEVMKRDGSVVRFQPGELHVIAQTPRRLSWKVALQSDSLSLNLIGEVSCEGVLDYKVQLSSSEKMPLKDVRLVIPFTNSKSLFMMGMGKEGGVRPERWHWEWNVNRHQDMVWLGGVNGGLALRLKDENYTKPLVNIYYPYGKLKLPHSWGNSNLGGCDITSTTCGAALTAYSGGRIMEKGKSIHFNFELMVTPFKLLSTKALFKERIYQNSSDDLADHYLSEANKVGANVITLHHKKDLNPFINYPYLSQNVPRLKRFVDAVHQDQKRVCLYYTTRELTVNAPEIWAFKSLGDEIIYPGPSEKVRTVINPDGPHPWLKKRFKGAYIPAWKCAIKKGKYAGAQDVAVITSPQSRLDNYYLEGLHWLCEHVAIDGLYLDGTQLDRDALRRARKIIDRSRPSGLIDMHIWNNYKELGSYANGINLYMDLFPFIDHLWIGEGRSYDTTPDYWLVEMSGIPFGLPSQMLNHGGNRWRGMVLGLTNRPGWYGPTTEYIWNYWDKSDFANMTMLGFWNKDNPVCTDNGNVYATVYQSNDKVIIAVANWSSESQLVHLYIDWKQLGFDPQKVKAKIPFIKDFQEEKSIDIHHSFRVKGNEGYLIELSEH